ncbi:serine/threonine protein kinase [Nostoc linckia z18]|uniref:histidine kinase n=2 Tax=Nostoc linckia TaxID=92942 RepID=A0A9Q6ELZ2_NOSLI|nr:AAA family ATPase [Nostoc linckia]PHK39448.1 serine/threonine protein kinase [Nostoc linckia z15]PHK44841.1 serine/threonine protein kinase [Nostoc linckia z16]PHJ61400.1 serine/threonine protein kinase [Nostoc linckia z1]PHJ64217.1 serine/threonine protein kinase [Nostoc linckia z3]PHJ71846.1 serine/threonine protein kinase [Nostoc linckia z2]
MSIVLDTLYAFPGYRITEQIYSGSKTLVYRGIREQDQKSVVLKLMRSEYPTFAEIAQFRNQYIITKNLDIPGIIKPYSLDNYRNSYILVMEDFGGISLQKWRLEAKDKKENKISVDEFFDIAIKIASILEGLHCDRIIHKDIKPANILINPTTCEIKIIDFSIATLLPRESQCLINPNVLEGTLAYISPEQTGRMNRGIDYRTDFYSLGVTFFELLTGQVPFTTKDPMELVYSHIAKQPLKASQLNSNIPAILSEIISKLMAKNAEERYQSVSGLKHDLEVCQKQWQEIGKIANFKLASRDISDRFVIPEKLYGRQNEVATLLAAFERVANPLGCSVRSYPPVSGLAQSLMEKEYQLTESLALSQEIPATCQRGIRGVEMILVAGFSGIGKTAVVNEVHKPILRQRSYFIKGKFDQFQRDIPLSGLVQAFRDLIGQLLSETDAQIQQWKAKILRELGTQTQVIIDVIPELEQIVGQQPLVTELFGSAAQNRFNLLFQKFIQIFTTKERPLVIFLDDLQWADTASLKLIQLLMCENSLSDISEDTEKIAEVKRSLLLIGSYRDNEISKAHPLYLTLQEIEQAGANISTINLLPLNQGDLNHLIADTLHCPELVAVPLTQMVFAKTKGNPFFSIQFLKSLYEEELIVLNLDLGYWQYDIAKIKELALTDDVVQFIAIQIEKLPINTQKVLKLAACIGNQFDLKSLAIVHEKSVVDTASDLWQALLDGLILPQTEIYNIFPADNNNQDLIIQGIESTEITSINLQIPKYKFVHDRVQQAAYSLIPEEQKKPIHLKIGLLLLSNIPIAEQEERIFELVNQLNIAVEFISHQGKRDELAHMNLIAGRKALASTAYATALKYLTIGIQLLAPDSWETKHHLTLALYETATEAAYLAGNFEQMEQFAEVVLLRKPLLEKIKVYQVKIQAYGAQNQGLEAINTALTFLKLLGVEFPEHPQKSDIQLAMAELASNLNGRRIQDLIELPEMIDAQQIAVMHILSTITAISYLVRPELFPLIYIKQINLSLKYGNSSLSAFAYVNYGLVLTGVVGDIESAYEFGQLGVNLVEKLNAKEVKTKIILAFNTAIRHWKEHTRQILKPLLESYYSGIETGDLEYAAYCLNAYSYSSYFVGRELTELEREMAAYSNAIAQIKQEIVFNWISIHRQSVLNLLGNVENPCCLIGEAYNEEKMLPLYREANDVMGIFYFYVSKLHLCYLFEKYPLALDNAILAEKYLDGGRGQLVTPILYFYDSLTRLALYGNASVLEQQSIMDKVRLNQEKMQHWTHHAPMNYLHKYYLVEAERCRIGGEYLEAIEFYDRAISLAKENEYLHEEALAQEVTAKFYLEWGKHKIAQSYLTDAYYSYVRWGAVAKVDDLVKRYPLLLAPVFQQEKLKLNIYSSQESTSLKNISLSSLSTQQTVIGSKTSISDSLDLATFIKASQALSGEIELERLLSSLMEVVIENAGASKCALILSEDDSLELIVTAVCSISNFENSYTEFPSISLESSYDVPITLINYVKRSREILVIDDAMAVSFLAADSYIICEEPKSLLSVPIINQGQLIGIIYLENNLTTGAFTRDRVEVLKLLTTQAAISLKNAILYKNLTQAKQSLEKYNHTLEQKVKERTQELNDKNERLQQAIQELKRAQIQLIQSEKMSSLGQMVAGIAHEINNPINFIHGNIAHASEYVRHLLELITVYQQEYPDSSPAIEDKSEEIDIDFLAKDLPKILDSMKVGSSRIRTIVLGLRNFSRLDEYEMKPVDIHEGIDNTLMILQHRLKEKNDYPEIEVIKEYGNLPEVTCYAGQLNQVFMNILSNAIDALEELSVSEQQINLNGDLGVSKAQQQIKNHSPKIRISTQLANSNTVVIRIADNGSGITEALRQKIFDPFFTTKSVGSGTGLGLSISYQIIVDKHKGNLTCNSTIGEGTEFVIEIPMQQG